ncbi:hypothetical protein Tco_1200217 [Tanacetum coccineum]
MILDLRSEEEDGEQIRFLGGNSSSGTKKYRGSNSNDGGNIGDGVKIAGEKFRMEYDEITLQAPFLNVQKTFEHSSSSLGRQCQMASAENNTSGPAPFLNVQMTSVHISSGLVLHQMTSDHNRSELGIQTTAMTVQFKAGVPKGFSLVNKTATSRQGWNYYFHFTCNAGGTTGIYIENNNQENRKLQKEIFLECLWNR